MSWAEFLGPYQAGDTPLLSKAFVTRWGGERWEPEDADRKAAGKLHVEVASRISTQRLGYLDGVEKSALDSVYALFQRTRDIGDEFPESRHFDALAWDVLNTRVRPFTAKWHCESQRGALTALDATDEFRAELVTLQLLLQRFDDLLLHLRDDRPPPRAADHPSERDSGIAGEMAAEVRWGIPRYCSGLESMPPTVVQSINAAEANAICARRGYYDIPPDKPHAVALALSGGGIRSATFSLGVLVALARRGVLPQFDYLSTVSGGGYLGSFLSAFLHSPNGAGIGLRADELPFRREEGEAAALRHLRHHSKYLAIGSWWQRLSATCAQLYGMLLNGLAIAFIAAIAVAIERGLRSAPPLQGLSRPAILAALGALALGALASLLAVRVRGGFRRHADTFVAAPAALLLTLLCWRGLGGLHVWFHGVWMSDWTWSLGDGKLWLALAGAIPLITSAAVALFGTALKRVGVLLIVLAAIAAPVFFLGLYLVIYEWSTGSVIALPFIDVEAMPIHVMLAGLAVGVVVYFWLLDINVTSPHRYYRNKLAEAYLIQPRKHPTDTRPFESAASVHLSDLGSTTYRGPYHLLNCALNVPGSQNPGMQGRLTEFFLFSPRYCGSPLTGYHETAAWEKSDAHLDLGAAMAISGAAAAPQMGLGTMKGLSFWLALLNVRLGYWIRKPGGGVGLFAGTPGLVCLLQEMLGTMDERLPWLNLSDGGHIENLGVYELLRRRCKYIVAVDGEQDPKMTFHALTTLQRLAAIDLDVRIDIDLDDLRLNEQGLSRSHFRFCRIRYPSDRRGSEDVFGYLLYVKLSLTGNEGEFIRRYRLDEPVFPHHSTADQFFTEAQFEAYRSLGEHVGDKLFLRAIVGDLADSKSVEVETWFGELGKNLLEPLRTVRSSSP